MIYLDWAASAPVDNKILEFEKKISRKYPGNPSSLHSPGREAAGQLKQYRQKCSKLLNVPAETLYFTSGGSEANNIIISSLFLKQTNGEVIVSGFEHPSVWDSVQNLKKTGYKIKTLNPGPSGIISPEKLKKMVNNQTRMICIMAVHNETGAVQNIEQLVSTVREKEVEENLSSLWFHCDMVQVPGKTSFSLSSCGVDSASFSGHKFGASRGTGLLYMKKQRDILYRGGEQEYGIRPGTENLPGIAGFTEALIKTEEKRQQNETIGNYFLKRLKDSEKVTLLPLERKPENFTPSIVSLMIPPLPGEVLVRVLNEKGFAISTGSACSSNKKMKTRGLESMGVPQKEAFSSIRVSTGSTTTRDEIDQFIDTLQTVIKMLVP